MNNRMDRAAEQISNLGDQVKEIFQKEGGKRYKIFFILFYKEIENIFKIFGYLEDRSTEYYHVTDKSPRKRGKIKMKRKKCLRKN